MRVRAAPAANLARVIRPSARPRWRARTIELAEPPQLANHFRSDGTAWLRDGQGMVGIGEVARFTGVDFAQAESRWQDFAASVQCETELGDHPGSGPVAFGSFVFDPGHTTEESVVVVPRMVLGHRRGRSWLTVLHPEGAPLPKLPAQLPPPTAPAGAEVVGKSLSRTDWQDAVAAAVRRIETNGLEKVVLARGEDVQTTDPLSPRWLVTELTRRYPSCWTFHVAGLLGASPEMLLRREGGLALSRVLAGTIRRGGTEELDHKLAHALARDGKNLIEHELAVASVAGALAPFCSGMNVPDAPYVLELPNVLHLASDITGVAAPGVSALKLAAELHPTAAVCGTPTGPARAAIAELENLDRGRYSGPVGWLDTRGDGEFAIALRSGRLHPDDPRTITIYAGCGIVAGSDPTEEYAETEAKLLPIREALGTPVGRG